MDCLKKAPPRRAGVVGMLKSVSSLTKGENKMSKKLIGLVVVMMLAAGTAMAVDESVVTVTVTPTGLSVSLTPPTTTYAFGDVAVQTSSGALTPITLTNNGSVGVTLKKNIGVEPAAWTAGATAAPNVYVLYVATSTTQPSYVDLAANCKYAASLASNNLTDAAGFGGGVVDYDDKVVLWFAIDMPTTSGSSSAQTIVTHIDATQN
ncbi:MAG: hypothetical protein CVU78_06050 [Elusimicrobia bacterium HGW-Elusimicrobia-2]|nr:MAG: hypothetical protein CVU78_06050 [Elusimicrobia bacterium HGW-Elusimicrobia-2]